MSFELAEYTAEVVGVGTLRLLDAIKTCGLEKQVRHYFKQAPSKEKSNSVKHEQNCFLKAYIMSDWFDSLSLVLNISSIVFLLSLYGFRHFNVNSKFSLFRLHFQVRFYQASTSELFGKVVEVPQKETTPFYPRYKDRHF